jgi:CBS domain-containing protein
METLRDVMSTLLVTVLADATVAEAAQVMSIEHVGSALIVDGEALRGIFTERDIVRALAAEHDARPRREDRRGARPDARGGLPAHTGGRG